MPTTTTPSVDVLIVGAGPAGSAAATWARRAGLSVMLVDRAPSGRDKCCGDGLTALALRELESLALQPERLGSWMSVTAACVRTPRGHVMRLPLPSKSGQFAAVCRRMELDTALVERAEASGAEVRFGVGFESFEDSGERGSTARVLLTDGTSVQARFVVAADGVYSAVRKALGIGPHRYRGDWHAFRGYANASGEAARDMWVWFEPDLLPGYAWSFPLGDGRVNLGFGVPRSAVGRHAVNGTANGTGTLAGSEIAAVWASLTQRPHIANVLGRHTHDAAKKAWPIPARMGGLELARGRTLLCGDAAAAADPLTGEGIGQALQMGRMAAAAIARGGPPHSVTSRYVTDVRAEYTLDHRLARGLSRVLAHERLAELSLGAVNMSGWTRQQFARWMFEDYPRAAIATPRRWHRGMLKAQGAFATRDWPVAVGTSTSPS